MTGAVLGLDLGTSGVKVVALDSKGAVLAQATAHYPLLTPQPGWAEQRPADWVAASVQALREVAEQLAQQGLKPLALGLSGQMHGLVPLDAGGAVIRPALLWNDARTAEQVAEIERTVPRAELIARTGNRAVAGFQLPKILWLRQNEPQHFAVMRLALLPKDYLGYVFTGQARSEPSDASGVGLLNLETLDWDATLLDKFALPRSLFPEVVASHTVIGGLLPELAQQTALPAGLPIVAGAGDNAAAAVALGLGHRHPQRGSLSLGTSGVIFAPLPTPTPDPQGRVHLFAHADDGFHLLGVTLAAGGALQWFRDRVAPERSFDELMEEARAVPAGAQGASFLPYLAGERSPWMNPELRGAWTGLSLAHGRGHLLRALLEGVALSLGDTWAVMRPLCGVQELLVTGGGATDPTWLDICAAVLGLPLLGTQQISTQQTPGPAHGAALLASVAAGWQSDVEAVIAAAWPAAKPLPVSSGLQELLKGSAAQFKHAQQALYGLEGEA